MEKNKLNGKRGDVEDEMKWVHDSSLDHNGRVPLRASTGAWKASFFIIGMALTCIFYPKVHTYSIFVRTYRTISIFCFDT